MEHLDNITAQKCESPLIFGHGVDILQYLDGLNWNVVEKNEYQQCQKRFIPPGFPVKDHTRELVNSGKIPFPEKPYKILPKEENGKDVKLTYVPGGIGTSCWPRRSFLTCREQFELYKLMCRNILYKECFSALETNKFQELMSIAQEEYPEYQEFVAKQWCLYQVKRCTEVKPQVVKYIDWLWKKKCEVSMSLYPEMYKDYAQDIALTLNDPNGDYTVMDFVKNVFFKGTFLKMVLPRPKIQHDLLTDFKKLCKIKAVSDEAQEGVKSIVQPTLPVSVDPVMEYLLDKHDVDIVISNSGIKAIVDNYNYKEWCLPVIIKNVNKIGGSTKKVVFVDKPLPPAQMSIHEKNKWHSKVAAKWLLILDDNPHLLDDDPHVGTTRRDDYERELTSYEDFLTDDLTKVDMGTESQEFLTKTNKEPKEKLPDHSCFSPPVMSHSPGSSNKDKISKLIKDADVKKNVPINVKQDKPKDKIKPCLAYRLWRLHKSKHFNMSKHEQRTLNILVRSKVDGKLCYFDIRKFKKIPHVTEVVVSSRLEFQPEYGVSKMDSSSLIREYVDLVLNHKLKIVRVRCVGHTGELLMTEVKTLQDIQPLVKDSQKIFDPLYAVLTRLIDMPTGHYMLRHTPRMGSFAHLLLESECATAFNLIQYCEQFPVREVEISVPPTLIDPITITPLNHFRKQPPALFYPRVHEVKANFLKKKNGFKVKKKRSRRQKKISPAQ